MHSSRMFLLWCYEVRQLLLLFVLTLNREKSDLSQDYTERAVNAPWTWEINFITMCYYNQILKYKS